MSFIEHCRRRINCSAISSFWLWFRAKWVLSFCLFFCTHRFQDPQFLADINIPPFFFWTASLTCFSDRMRAIISKSYLASLEYSENSLQLNNSTCRPRISNVVEFSIPLDGCGTIKKVSETLVAGFHQRPKAFRVMLTVWYLPAALMNTSQILQLNTW